MVAVRVRPLLPALNALVRNLHASLPTGLDRTLPSPFAATQAAALILRIPSPPAVAPIIATTTAAITTGPVVPTAKAIVTTIATTDVMMEIGTITETTGMIVTTAMGAMITIGTTTAMITATITVETMATIWETAMGAGRHTALARPTALETTTA